MSMTAMTRSSSVKKACIGLRLIFNSFFTIGATQEPHNLDTTAALQEDPTVTCLCPRRQRPPPPPTKVPFPATDANRQKLQQYLLDYYKADAFNTCDHQTLPLMNSPPMKLMVDPDAEPVEHETQPQPLQGGQTFDDIHYTLG